MTGRASQRIKLEHQPWASLIVVVASRGLPTSSIPKPSLRQNQATDLPSSQEGDRPYAIV
jgi:hypothetical protein